MNPWWPMQEVGKGQLGIDDLSLCLAAFSVEASPKGTLFRVAKAGRSFSFFSAGDQGNSPIRGLP